MQRTPSGRAWGKPPLLDSELAQLDVRDPQGFPELDESPPLMVRLLHGDDRQSPVPHRTPTWGVRKKCPPFDANEA